MAKSLTILAIFGVAGLWLIERTLLRPENIEPRPLPAERGEIKGFRHRDYTSDGLRWTLSARRTREGANGSLWLTAPEFEIPAKGQMVLSAKAAGGRWMPPNGPLSLMGKVTLERSGIHFSCDSFNFDPSACSGSGSGARFDCGGVAGECFSVSLDCGCLGITDCKSCRLGAGKLALSAPSLKMVPQAREIVLEGPISGKMDGLEIEGGSGSYSMLSAPSGPELQICRPKLSIGESVAITARRASIGLAGDSFSVRLAGDMRLRRGGRSSSAIEAETLTVSGDPGGGWNWSFPENLAWRGSGQTVRASAATGKGRTGSMPDMHFSGPISGVGAWGKIKADSALLGAEGWLFQGHCAVASTGMEMRSETIWLGLQGEARCQGGVIGRFTSSDRALELDFRADEADLNARSHEFALSGQASVSFGSLTLMGPRLEGVAGKMLRALGGSACLISEAGGKNFICRAEEISVNLESLSADGKGSATVRSGGTKNSGQCFSARLGEGFQIVRAVCAN